MNRGDAQSRLLLRFLPPYARTVACSWPESLSLGTPRLIVGSTSSAHNATVDGLIVDERALGGKASALPEMLGLLRGGGVAVIDVPSDFLSRATWAGICAGSGLTILQKNRKDGRFSSVAGKPLFRDAGSADTKLSIVMVVTGTTDKHNYRRASESIFAWMSFLLSRNMFDKTEFLLVDDGILDEVATRNLEEAVRQGHVKIIPHYESFGTGAARWSGFSFAAGRRVLFDESGGGVDPESLLPMLTQTLREEKAVRDPRAREPDRTIAFGWTPDFVDRREEAVRRFSRTWSGLFAGCKNPNSDFRLYPREAARLLAALSPSFGGRRIATGALPVPKGWKLRNIPVVRSDGKKDQLPGFFSAILRRRYQS